METTTTNPQPLMQRRRVIRGVMRKIIAALLATLTDFKIIGQENIPKEGPLLVIGNHFSFIDPVAMIHIMPRPIEFIGGTQLINAPVVVRWIPPLWGIFRVHRGSASREALQSAQYVLNNNGALGIFPEASSGATVLRRPRPGAALLAARTKAKILPVGFDGLTDVFPLFSNGKRARVVARIGKPFGPFNLNIKGRADREALDDISETMMKEIANLIPPERRGVYSADPQLRMKAENIEDYQWHLNPER